MSKILIILHFFFILLFEKKVLQKTPNFFLHVLLLHFNKNLLSDDNLHAER